MVWLSQAQMAQLFDTSADSISLHLKNIFAENELNEKSTTEDFSVVRQEGKRESQTAAQTLQQETLIRLMMHMLQQAV